MSAGLTTGDRPAGLSAQDEKVDIRSALAQAHSDRSGVSKRLLGLSDETSERITRRAMTLGLRVCWRTQSSERKSRHDLRRMLYDTRPPRDAGTRLSSPQRLTTPTRSITGPSRACVHRRAYRFSAVPRDPTAINAQRVGSRFLRLACRQAPCQHFSTAFASVCAVGEPLALSVGFTAVVLRDTCAVALELATQAS